MIKLPTASEFRLLSFEQRLVVIRRLRVLRAEYEEAS